MVGRLASELSVDVQLAPSPVTGITARVKVPTSLLDVVTPVRLSPRVKFVTVPASAELVLDAAHATDQYPGGR